MLRQAVNELDKTIVLVLHDINFAIQTTSSPCEMAGWFTSGHPVTS